MNGLLGMGWLGWAASLAAGFAVGLVFFLSMKLQVEYVVEKRGPTWLLPAAMYARLVLVAVVLVLVALLVRAQGWQAKLPAMMLAGVAGTMLARIVVARMVRRKGREEGDQDADG